MNKIIQVLIPQIVRIRKYNVDVDRLKKLLKSHKNLTNNQIAELLNIPKTKVEHWFRNDKWFDVPDPEYWMQLKQILKIDSNEFDESIMTFEEKIGNYDMAERCYMDYGIAPTLTVECKSIKVIRNEDR